VFFGKIGFHRGSIGNCHAESDGCKSITDIVNENSYTVCDYLSVLDWIYYEHTSETYTKKSMAPKETMGGIHKMLSENKTQQFSSVITITT